MTHILCQNSCHRSMLNCNYRGCSISKIINDIVEYCLIICKAFTRINFNRLSTRVELCACTSDRKHSTHTVEVCMSRKPKPGLILILISM